MAEFGERQNATDRVRERYRRIDAEVPLGELPVERYHAWHLEHADAASLDAQANYEIGWIELERMIAMRRHTASSPKEIGMAAETAREHFFAAAKAPNADPELRARARVAAGSVGTFLEMALGVHTIAVGVNHVPLLRSIQQAGSDLLVDPGTATIDYMQSLAAMGLLNEFFRRDGWFLPPAPRQLGDIVAYDRQGDMYPITLGEQAVPNVVSLPQHLLDDDSWGTMSAPLATLQAFIQAPAGFHTKLRHTGHKKESYRQKFIKTNLQRIAFNLKETFSAGSKSIKSVREYAKPAGASEPQASSLTPQAEWFMHQSLSEPLPFAQLEQHMHNLEATAEQTGLDGGNHHVLGWMQLEYGRIMVEQAGSDANPETLLVAAERFDTATQSFIRAAETFLAQKKYGDAASLFLDIEASTMYKALFTQLSQQPEAPQAHLQQSVESYVRQLAALTLKMRDMHHLITNDEQADAFYEAVLRLTACLLVTAATDEASRHLVVSTSLRGVGSHNDAADVSAFPFVYEQGYDKDGQVNISISPTGDIAVSPGLVTIGLQHLLPKPNQPLYVARKLAAVVRVKPGAAQQETRGKALDSLTQRIADAITDAYET